MAGLEKNGIVATNLTQARDEIARKRPDVVLLDLCFDGSAQNGLALLAEMTKGDRNCQGWYRP